MIKKINNEKNIFSDRFFDRSGYEWIGMTMEG